VKKTLRSCCFCILVLLTCVPSAFAQNLKDSIVKVFVNTNRMDYLNPWQSHGGQEFSGSGAIIEGNRIITNAHVINDSTFIQVRKESDPRKFVATVEAVGLDCDLAILRVDDPEFFKGVIPLEFGDLPNLQEFVTAFGYPLGGDKLSITGGVVSRIEIIPYAQSNRPLLGVQIDAAINPGNSGGPVLKDGKIVGVAMQGITASQNIGFMIPVPIIDHFLSDLKDAEYDGFPYLGIAFHNTENKEMRRYYRVPDNVGGVVVTHVVPYTSSDGILREGDVVLELDGIPVASDGTIPFRNNESLNMSYAVNSKQVGEKIDVKYFRDGQVRSEKIELKPAVDLVKISNYYTKPPYYIYGGLVFTVLSVDLINEWRALGQGIDNRFLISIYYWAFDAGQLNEKRKKDFVVLSEVLPDSINVGYHEHQSEIITKVNGQEFGSFKEFVTLVENAGQEFVVFENENKQKLIISSKDADRVTGDILKRNNIPGRYSEDVGLWLK
jgi:S1-C subfamily serine protease